MKQKGPQWIGPDGVPTSHKYVPEYERRAEHIGQRLASMAIGTEDMLRKHRQEFVKLCDEMYTRYRSDNPKSEIKSFSFTTFDKGYRIEVDMTQEPRVLYRVYEATKPNPQFKDYRLVCMDFSRTWTSNWQNEETVQTPASMPLFNEEEAQVDNQK